jgi:hypothetical protein
MVFFPPTQPAYLSGKTAVEYTFKNSLSEKAFTIILNQESIIMQSAGKEESIPYEHVTSVKLCRTSDSGFRIKMTFHNHDPIVISNRYYLPSGESEDRSRQYGPFVRILHFHLKSKSAPVYSSGNSFRLLVIWGVLSAFFSFLISFISEYLGLSLIDPFLQALFMTAILLLAIFVKNRSKLPKEYSPEDIPLQFLP